MNKNKEKNMFNPFDVDQDLIKKMFGDIIGFDKGPHNLDYGRDYNDLDFNKSFKFYEPFHGKVEFEKEIDTLKLLDIKMRKAIMDENYEDAAKIRDLIKSLKEDNSNDPK